MYRITVSTAYEDNHVITSRVKTEAAAVERAKQTARDYSLTRHTATVDVLIYNEPVRAWSLIWSVNAQGGKCLYPNADGIGWRFEDDSA